MVREPRSSRKTQLIVVAVVVVGLLVVGGIVMRTLGGGSDDPAPTSDGTIKDPPAPPPLTASPSPSSSSGSSPAPGKPGASPTKGSGTPSGGATTSTGALKTLPPVPFTRRATFGDGVSARVTSSKAVTGKASGPGETDGPAIAFTVRLTNNTGKPLSVEAVTVNAYSGKQAAPAPPVTGDPRNKPFSGRVPPGATEDATYVFTVPRSERGKVRLEVNHAALSPIVAFQGSAG